MSTFNNNGLTLKGAVILASLVAGSRLTFTRIAVGDGELPAEQSVLETTKLVNHLFDVGIVSVESDSVAHATAKGVLNTAALETGFYYRELGLFAINPTTGAEELYCYGNAGDLAEWISPAGGSSLIEKEIHVVTLIGNAAKVEALFDPKAPVLKSEFDAIMPLKADLDDTPENGGRVLASQMRFEQNQIMYVDAAASSGGDGSEAKPFKTIAEAVAARYRGTNNIVIYIKPGNYPENVKVEAASGSSWAFVRWGDSGTVTLRTMEVRNCNFFEVNKVNFSAADAEYLLSINRNAGFLVNECRFDGGTSYGLMIGTSVGLVQTCEINNTANAVYAWGGSFVAVVNVSGTGNSNGFVADNSVISDRISTLKAQNTFVRNGGGAHNPASWQYIDDGTTNVTTLPAGVYTIRNGRAEQGLPANYDGTLIVDALTGHKHMIFFYDAQSKIFHRIMKSDGSGWNDWEDYIPEAPTASVSTFGLIRTTSVEDEQNCQCNDAAVTPASLYDLSDYRKANTSYSVGTVVGCPYHAGFLLKCTQAGKTSDGALDTTGATLGKVYTDGGVKWEVIVLPVELGGTGAATKENARSNLAVNLKTYTTFEQLGFSSTPTLTALLEAIPAESQFVGYISSNETNILEVPDGGVLTIIKGRYRDYASIEHARYGGDNIIRRIWRENWVAGQTGFLWKKIGINGAMSMPANSSSNRIEISSTALSDGYKAPCDGWITLACSASSGQQSWMRLYRSGMESWSTAITVGQNDTGRIILPVCKDMLVKMAKGSVVTFEHAFFFPSQNEVN